MQPRHRLFADLMNGALLVALASTFPVRGLPAQIADSRSPTHRRNQALVYAPTGTRALMAGGQEAVSTTKAPRARITFGKHAVGFRAICDTVGRAVAAREQLLIWYPARKPAAATPMSFSEYLAPSREFECGTTTTRDQRVAFINAFAQQLASASGLPGEEEPLGGRLFPKDSAASIALHLGAARTKAFPMAPQIAGKFPVVVFAPAGAIEQSVLMESLASHGYIVVTFPHALSPPSGVARAGVESGATRDVTVAREIDRAIDRVIQFGNADRGRVAVIANGGFISGALWLQARTKRLSAIVTMEGRVPGARLRTAATSTIGFRVAPADSLPSSFVQEWTIPVLDWQHANNEYTRGVLELFTRAERIRLDTKIAHPSDWVARRIVHPRDTLASTVNDVLGLYVRQFLDYTLKHQTSASAFFDRAPDANGVLVGLLAVQRLRADSAPR